MIPGRYDLPVIWRFCDWGPIALTWLDANGHPINLTRWFPLAQTKDFFLNAVKTDAVNGVTQISLTKEETAVLALGVYQWDWMFTLDTGRVIQPLLSGTVEVKEPPLAGDSAPTPQPPHPPDPDPT